jgi:uncharacterized membrane protein YoaK (UPF0700 family)
MDALSYLRAKVFTANMTGNTVVLGLGIVGPDRSRLPDCVLAIGAFAPGSLLAGAILVRLMNSDERNELKLGIVIEMPFAIGFALLWAVFHDSGQPHLPGR